MSHERRVIRGTAIWWDTTGDYTSTAALAKIGIEIKSSKVYSVIHKPSGGAVDIREEDLLKRCSQMGARTVFEQRAVLLDMATAALKELQPDRRQLGSGEAAGG